MNSQAEEQRSHVGKMSSSMDPGKRSHPGSSLAINQVYVPLFVPQGRASCAGKHSLSGVFGDSRSSEKGACGRTEGLRAPANQTLTIWRLSGELDGADYAIKT